MSDFEWKPSAQTRLEEEPKVLSARFGDGYEQRTLDGINAIAQIWSVAFRNRPTAEANAILNFLRAKSGVTPFTWTPPAGAEIRVICRKWPKQFEGGTTLYHSFDVVFEQVFGA